MTTRRRPVRKTMYARLFNKSKPKRQRAAAGTAPTGGMEEGGINISRSLTIIFLIHILAIGMIFIHKQYLADRTPTPVTVANSTKSTVATEEKEPDNTQARNNSLPVLSSGDKLYMVKKGDNYGVIAERFQVDEGELRNLNKSADIRPRAVLRIPKGRRIIAETPPEVHALGNDPLAPEYDSGLVEIFPEELETGQAIRPSAARPEPKTTAAVASGKTHVVKSGENIWRISNTYKVGQDALMKLNGITDPTKLKIGQVLKLP